MLAAQPSFPTSLTNMSEWASARPLPISSYAAGNLCSRQFRAWIPKEEHRQHQQGFAGEAMSSSSSSSSGSWKTASFALAGLTAGVASSTVTAPADRLRVLLATGQMRTGIAADSTLASQVYGLVARGGVSTLWRGNLANCLKVAPSKAFNFACMEHCLTKVCKDPKRPQLLESVAVSCWVASMTTLAGHPLDTIRTRLAASEEASTILNIFRSIVRERGPRGLMQGVLPSLASNVPFIGVNLGVFTSLKASYNEQNGREAMAKPPTPILLGMTVVSTAIAELVSYPLFVIKTNIQAGHTSSWRGTVATVLRQRGPMGFYHGVSVTAAKSFVTTFVSYYVYENAKALLA